MKEGLTEVKGLSLLEVLVTMGIGIVVGAILMTVMVNSAGLFYKQSSKVQGGLNVNDALSEVRKDIKSSNGVVASAILGDDTYTSSPTQIILKIPAIDWANNIIPDVYDYFVYFLENNQLRYKTFPAEVSFRKAQDRIFSTNANGLTFEYLNSATPPLAVAPQLAAKVKMTLSLRQKSGSDYEQVYATSEASLRND